MPGRRASSRARLLIIIGGLTLAACHEVDTARIHALLDARDDAVTNRDIAAYSRLIDPDYRDGDRGKVEAVAGMVALFDRFDGTRMRSFDREIRFSDDDTAECHQSYALEVARDGTRRRIVHRERLRLSRTDAGWRISGGL